MESLNLLLQENTPKHWLRSEIRNFFKEFSSITVLLCGIGLIVSAIIYGVVDDQVTSRIIVEICLFGVIVFFNLYLTLREKRAKV